jgi:hypothetical protein
VIRGHCSWVAVHCSLSCLPTISSWNLGKRVGVSDGVDEVVPRCCISASLPKSRLYVDTVRGGPGNVNSVMLSLRFLIKGRGATGAISSADIWSYTNSGILGPYSQRIRMQVKSWKGLYMNLFQRVARALRNRESTRRCHGLASNVL